MAFHAALRAVVTPYLITLNQLLETTYIQKVTSLLINPRHACAARVTVVGLSV